MIRFTRLGAAAALIVAACLGALAAMPASAQPLAGPPQVAQPASSTYNANQLVTAGQNFFGQVSGNLAQVIENAVSRFGLPNGYILGTTGGGAIVAGVRYGSGTLYTQNQGTRQVYWRGPSIGFDVGGDFSQTMILVYDLPSIDAIYQRFFGAGGNAYVVGGVGMTVLTGNGITLVPIVSGLGARVGINISYLRFSPQANANPF
ncbi:MAG: DUF1134 domain-containing protein [Bauldia sp.]|nr:DUF1134 domain-containing protein [Bauldia sp.]